MRVTEKRKNILCVGMVLNTVLKQKGVELWTASVRFLYRSSVVITCCGVNLASLKKNGMAGINQNACCGIARKNALKWLGMFCSSLVFVELALGSY